MSRLLSRPWLVLVLAVAATAVATAEPQKPKRGRPHHVVPTGADDAPGAPAPDAAAEAELEAMTSRSAVGLTSTPLVGGGVMLDLDGRFMNVALATEGGTTCHTGATAVAKSKAARKRTKGKAKSKARGRRAPVIPTVGGLEVM